MGPEVLQKKLEEEVEGYKKLQKGKLYARGNNHYDP